MVIRFSILFLLFLMPTKAFSDFCYREASGSLVCHTTYNEVPDEFKNLVFYLDKTPKKPPLIKSIDPEPQALPSSSPVIKSSPALKNTDSIKLNTVEKSPAVAPVLPRISLEPKPSSAPEAPRNTTPSGLPPAKGYEESFSQIQNESEPLEQARAHAGDIPEVTIYVASWCPHCRALEQHLKIKGIPFKRVNVEKDPVGIELYAQEKSIPITQIGETMIVGFEPERLDSIIESKMRY